MPDTPEQIVAEIADITRRHGGRGRLYEFTPEQEAALKALGLLMHPTKEEHIVAGVLEDAKEAGWSLVRLDDCEKTEWCSTHHGNRDQGLRNECWRGGQARRLGYDDYLDCQMRSVALVPVGSGEDG